MDLSGGDGLKEHGGSELHGLGVFKRREEDLILAGIGALDVAEFVFLGALETELLPVGGHGLDDWRTAMGAAQLDVEVAEVSVFECGGAAAAAVGFDVAAER